MQDVVRGHNVSEKASMGQQVNGSDLWDKKRRDELTLGRKERGRNERDKVSVGRNEWDEMNGTK